jgi:hypothetical protein
VEIVSPVLIEYLHHFCLDFEFNFLAGGDGGGGGDIFRVYLVRMLLKIQGYGSDEKIIESEIFGMAQK